MPKPFRKEIMPGTLDLLILKTLAVGADHGYGIAKAIQRESQDVLCVEEGSLYPALHRLEKRGHIAGSWTKSDTGRRVREYVLTPDGRAALKRETTSWHAMSAAIGRVLNARIAVARGTAGLAGGMREGL